MLVRTRTHTPTRALLGTALATALLAGPIQPSWAAPPAPARSVAVAEVHAAAAARSTKVVGWRAARRSPYTVGLLDSLYVSGPVGRRVKVQRKSHGRWKTVRVVRTSAEHRVDVGFIRERVGRWRLKVPARGSWRGFTTSSVRIRVAQPAVAPAVPGPQGAAGPAVGSPIGVTPPGSAVYGAAVYGAAYNMDALGNLEVGGSANTVVSYRFRAQRSDALSSFRAYWLNQDYSGYGAGTGGTIRVSVESDAGGVPSGVVLGSVDVVHPASDFPLLRFPAPPVLTAGALYHLVFTNIDPRPTANFVSVDCIWTATTFSPRQPGWSDVDLAVLERRGSGAWAEESRYTPIMDLTYASGARQGQGYMELQDTPLVVSGASSMIRERITVSGGARVVTGAAVRLARSSGTGNLVVRLEDSSGALIDSFTVSAGAVPVLSSSGLATGSWVSGSFSAPRTLANGATYHLRLSTDAGTSMWTRGIQQGSKYGFDPATYFGDGVLETTGNGGSSWSTVSGLGAEGDLQFYLR